MLKRVSVYITGLMVFAVSVGLFAAPERVLLKNGVPVVLNTDQSSELVAINVFINAGSAYENDADNGTAGLAFSMLTRGTKLRSAEKFAEETESLGVVLGASAGDDHSTVSMTATKKNFASGLELLADAFLNPVFAEEELSKVKQVALARIKSLEDDSFSYAMKGYRELLFKDDSYRFDTLGSAENVNKISAADLAAFHAKNLTAGNILISVSGDFIKEDMLETLNFRFKALKEGGRAVFPARETVVNSPNEGKQKTEKNQSVVLVGFICPKIAEKDYAALKVLNSVLGGGMSSKLFRDLREKEGLAYSIGSFYPSRRKASGFTFYAGTRKDNIEKVKKGMLDAAALAGTEGYISAEEFENARNYLVGQFRLDHQRNASKAWYLGWYENTGIGFEYDEKILEELKAVKLADLTAAAKKYFTANSVTFVLESN